MPEHENVTCPRCGAHFECRVGSILRCQCQRVTLDEAELAFIATGYSECLCANCLEALKREFSRIKERGPATRRG